MSKFMSKNQNAAVTGAIYGVPAGLLAAATQKGAKNILTTAAAIPFVTTGLSLIASTQQSKMTVGNATKEGAVVGTVAGTAVGAGVAGLAILASMLNEAPKNDTYPEAYTQLYQGGPGQKMLAATKLTLGGAALGALVGTVLGATQGAITGNEEDDD